MGSAPLNSANHVLVSAFQSALLHQLLVIVLILAVLAVAWNALRSAQLRRAIAAGPGAASALSDDGDRAPEPPARHLLRVGFGLLWLFDGLLQAQAAMPVGLGDQVVKPAAAASPAWVQHLVGTAVSVWDRHPVTAAVAVVWIQVGIGVWMLVAPRGRWSRAGAAAGAVWGLVVWVVGEAFGQIFAPGLSILFGAPGAALFYCVAGGLVAAPDRIWADRRTGRFLLAGLGGLFVGMAVLQAWPGRGFWQGTVTGHPGTLVAMVRTMQGASQPGFVSGWLGAFADVARVQAALVNAAVVAVLVGVGACFLSGRPRAVRPALVVLGVFGLLDWVFVQDFGFFGGLGTDPNSMVPLVLVSVAGYLAVVRPASAVAPDPATAEAWRDHARRSPTYAFRLLAAGAAALVTLLGVVPAAAASVNGSTDPIVTVSANGPPQLTDAPAPGFSLTDQNGRTVDLAQFRGRTVVLAFLDPVCTTQCPTIGAEMKAADQQLGSRSSRVVFVAVDANPVYLAPYYLQAFDHEVGLDHLPNWEFLTGSHTALENVWIDYGVQATVFPAGSMVDHSEITYVIDGRGHTRSIMNDNPDGASQTSFVALLLQQIDRVTR